MPDRPQRSRGTLLPDSPDLPDLRRVQSIAGRPPRPRAGPPLSWSGERRRRTYEIRTYGCQMNAHDSERVAGLLEDAGYRSAAGTARPPTWWCSTPARSGRTPPTGCTATSATCSRSRTQAACRSRWAAAWPRWSARRITAARALGRRGLRHAQHRLAARPARAGPERQEAQAEFDETLRDVPVAAARPPPVRLRGLGRDLGRLQQHLHVLHRAEPARQGEGPPSRRHPGRDHARWSPTASSRSPCSART